VSPTTIIVALFGLNHVSWYPTRSLRVSALKAYTVPDPVIGSE
jgi:hypothetical protein